MSVDVIIVGAGIAGLMCAYDCVRAGQAVLIVYQGDLEHTSSFYAQGGIAAAWLDSDSTAQHMTDTMMAGDGLCDPRVVQDFCDHAPAFIQRLIDLGVPFDQDAGGYRLTKEGAHEHSRIFHVKDHTGTSIIQTLGHHLKDHPLVQWENHALQGVLQSSDQSRVIGVRFNDQNYLAPNTVLATGGFSNIFSRSTNPRPNIGEGIALAYAVGAPVGDLEFIQFHPTVFCTDSHPPLLISEALRGEGAFLVNKNNERFMKKYHELEDLAPRDVVSRAMIQESGPKLNIVPLMTSIQYRFPTIYHALQARGFSQHDIEIPVQPLVHYTLGGIVAKPNGQTEKPGLFAIGECSLTGFHGANRLASNSLLEAGIMGQRCASFLIQHAKSHHHNDTSHHLTSMDPLASEDLIFLGHLTNQALGVIRSSNELTSAIDSLGGHPQKDHPMFLFLMAILHSALHRKESRGGHYRSDFPDTHANARHSLVAHSHELLHVDAI
tara:strand:+ start:1873 stop:3348 length:1476 start_codon:yes stop_codon:yes gene_type:complete